MDIQLIWPSTSQDTETVHATEMVYILLIPSHWVRSLTFISLWLGMLRFHLYCVITTPLWQCFLISVTWPWALLYSFRLRSWYLFTSNISLNHGTWRFSKYHFLWEKKKYVFYSVNTKHIPCVYLYWMVFVMLCKYLLISPSSNFFFAW